MHWEKIKSSEVDEWNVKLKQTQASFFQYPYYTSGYKHFPLSRPVHIRLLDKGKERAFAALLEIKFIRYKIGLIIRGPVIIDYEVSLKDLFNALKEYARKENYVFIRINPDNEILEDILKHDSDFQPKDYFSLYRGSQGKDFNINSRPEAELLSGFQTMCRRKIKYAEEVDFTYSTVKTPLELKKVYELFEEVGRKKFFKYRPYKSYKEIFLKGNGFNLCEVYTAKLGNELICAAFIVKDSSSFNYLSGGLVVRNFNPKNSPANKLHYHAIKDCFYEEQKSHYNISYSDPSSDVYVFKNSFYPVVVEKPGYYTYVVNKKVALLVSSLQKKNIKKVKDTFRRLTRFVK